MTFFLKVTSCDEARRFGGDEGLGCTGMDVVSLMKCV